MRSPFKQINICNLYLFFWLIYALHWSNAMYPAVESISNLILGFNMMISLWCSWQALRNYSLPNIFRAINLLVIVFIFYGIFYILFGPDQYHAGVPVKRGTYLVSVLRSFLPIYVFYVFTVKGLLTENVIRFWALAFGGIYFVCYSRALYFRSLISTNLEFVNNTGYLFAVILPCVFFFRKHTVIQLAYVGTCFFFVIMAMKRGAILTALCVIALFFKDKFHSAKKFQKLYVGILLLCAAAWAYSFVSERMMDSDAFQRRIEQTKEGNTSHRDVLARDFLNYYFNVANPIQQIIGSGADATLTASDNWAHNDWLEMLICQGLFGVCIYLYFWIAFFREWRSTEYPLARNVIGAVFVVYLLRTFFSMTYSMMLTPATMCLGYSLAINRIKTERKIYRR